jgi:hypothetical protein
MCSFRCPHRICRVQLPQSALELRRAETTDSASHLEAQLQAGSVKQLKQFPENHDITGSQKTGARDSVPDDSSTNSDAEGDLMPGS